VPRRLLPAVLGAAALAAAAPAAAPAAPVLALQDDKVFVNQTGPFSQDVAYGHLETLGVKAMRVSIAWNDALRKDGTYDFTRWQTTLRNAKARGITVRFSLAGPAPARFTSNRKVGFTRPNPTAYGRFAGAAARALRDAGGFSIWNEPNWHRLLSPARESPARYRSMYIAAYSAIKKVDPRKPVLLGELAPGNRPELTVLPLRFLREMTCLDSKYKRKKGTRCKELRADGVALHPYNFTSPPTKPLANKDAVEIASLGRAVSAMTKLRKAKALRYTRGTTMPLYLTEMGYFTAGSRRSLTLSTTARYLAGAWAQAKKIPSVKEFLQYLLVNPPQDSPDDFRTGLFSPDGVPYPSFGALQNAVRGTSGTGTR
jgi:hypothetical protein